MSKTLEVKCDLCDESYQKVNSKINSSYVLMDTDEDGHWWNNVDFVKLLEI